MSTNDKVIVGYHSYSMGSEDIATLYNISEVNICFEHIQNATEWVF